MDSIYRPIPYMFKDIVDNVRNNFSEEKIVPYYDFGTTTEIVNRLTSKSSSKEYKYKKYPLIWFVVDGSVPESINDMKREAKDITIVFCVETKASYSSEERYENNIIPILRPMYEMFMYYLKQSRDFRSIDKYTHEYFENLFWGASGEFGISGNVFNDRLDAIIVNNLNLLVNQHC